MPSIVLKTKNRTVVLDARPDRPDFRDLPYRPPLVCLPPEHPPRDFWTKHLPKYRKAGMILDQGEEGACTGFGLAAVINYLLYRQRALGKQAPAIGVSERMLYHLARKYDEWRGEDYEGSSCRGAIKGWFHHGVCSAEIWPYRNGKGEVEFVSPGKEWAKDAAQRPLGAYYRVGVDSIADLQAAIHEVGAVYVSSDVHRGWDEVPTTKKALPTIPWKPGVKIDGGHSYALVGYDAAGLVIQNSWGQDWGYYGFARLLYADWLKHAADAWVAVLSAPVADAAPGVLLSSRFVPKSAPALALGLVNGATASAVLEPVRPNAWSTEAAITHTLILGNDGRPDHLTVQDENAAAAVGRACYELPRAWLAKRKKGDRRILIYAHGGLNDLGDSLSRVKIVGPSIERNGAYPLFVAWQTGYLKSIANIVDDLVTDLFGAPETRKTGLFDMLGSAKDYAIERAAIPLARPVWSQMKQNAVAAASDGGGMEQLAAQLAKLRQDFDDLEVHLVGHSARSSSRCTRGT